MKSQIKQTLVELAIGLFILFAVVMLCGPTAGVNSIAYKIAMRIYMGA